MKKNTRFQFFVILTVIGITVYNILPTLFFYTKPLAKQLGEQEAYLVAQEALDRVNQLEQQSIDWIKSYTQMLKLDTERVRITKKNPQLVEVVFRTVEGAERFQKHLPRAGSLISFFPSQLSLAAQATSKGVVDEEKLERTVMVQRRIPIHFSSETRKEPYSFVPFFDQEKAPTKAHKELIEDRLCQLIAQVTYTAENAKLAELAVYQQQTSSATPYAAHLVRSLVTYNNLFKNTPEVATPFFASFTYGLDLPSQTQFIDDVENVLTSQKDRIQQTRLSLSEEDTEKVNNLQTQENEFLTAIGVLRDNKAKLASFEMPFGYVQARELCLDTHNRMTDTTQYIPLGERNPIIDMITVDWNDLTVSLHVRNDLLRLQALANKSTAQAIEQLIYDEIARINRATNETLTPNKAKFTFSLARLQQASSCIKLNLKPIAKGTIGHLKHLISSNWHPASQELQKENYPHLEWPTFKKLPQKDKQLNLVFYAPGIDKATPPDGFQTDSIYIIAKDLYALAQHTENQENKAGMEDLNKDVEALHRLLSDYGLVARAGASFPFDAQFADDLIFELPQYYAPVLQATREQFFVTGTGKYALLELSDLKQRLHTQNAIDDKIHKDLLKWQEEYQNAQVDIAHRTTYDIPPPTRSPLISNFILSAKKYFRGDEKNVLRWGLDLSGGKTVQISLKNASGQLVQEEAEINQGINELYSRVNKMGVSDVNIRREGQAITLDFPSAQALSASELIKASSMSFHLVNEKFSLYNRTLAEDVNRFLQEVYNEALVTNKTDLESIQRIAYEHLHGSLEADESVGARTESARVLLNQGLKLSHPEQRDVSANFSTEVSQIGIIRGDKSSDWYGQSHPLIILFNNFAVEGTNLENVHAGYEASRGNYLSFGVKSSQTTPKGEKFYPQAALYEWTKIFSRDRIGTTEYSNYTNGQGYRMAIVLNGTIINAPPLEGALQNGGIITGRFTQQEINHLVADLKAGSLSLIPVIQSVKNVSPELGYKERVSGITATILALIGVILLMTAYYRFSGLIASIAVFFNLLIIWAVLQNLQATVSLAFIAGVILTVGMAVDANVLVFERIREEFATTKHIKHAIKAGYQKAFSAILDSNVTTIIASLILLNFDAGPIKGFALSLIIGIVSSMFTALYMTRAFFYYWSENPKNTELKMSNWISGTNWDFLKHRKAIFSLTVLLTVIGLFSLFQQSSSILGMDFTGGYAVDIELQKGTKEEYRTQVEHALLEKGVNIKEAQVRELSNPHQLRLTLSNALNQSDRPFYGMMTEEPNPQAQFAYENNPRLVWLVNALKDTGLRLSDSAEKTLEQNFRSVSGQMSDTMRNNALFGLFLSLIAILIYITVRFEFTYAISATIGLFIDILLTLSLLALFFRMGLPLQIDLNIIAALMTIVGYSLNDTIIVFDRIREDIQEKRNIQLYEVINSAINTTLSRTLMTSLTTLLVLVILVCFGGQTLFGFSFVMALGVIIGTLSTLFIASSLLWFFSKRATKPHKTDVVVEM